LGLGEDLEVGLDTDIVSGRCQACTFVDLREDRIDVVLAVKMRGDTLCLAIESEKSVRVHENDAIELVLSLLLLTSDS